MKDMNKLTTIKKVTIIINMKPVRGYFFMEFRNFYGKAGEKLTDQFGH